MASAAPVLQTIVNRVDVGMPLERALNAPRMSQRNKALTDVEPGFAGTLQAKGLERLGQQFDPEAAAIGATNAIAFHPDGSVTAVREAQRHGVGSALVQKPAR